MSGHTSHLPVGCSAYSNSKCRCEGCRAAWSDYNWQSREARFKTLGEAGFPQPIHGKASTYYNWKCRCEPCVAAEAAEHRARREAKR